MCAKADIAVLATALIGRAPPVHSVGLLPLPYLSVPLPSLAALALANAAQLTRQATRKGQVRGGHLSPLGSYKPIAELTYPRSLPA